MERGVNAEMMEEVRISKSSVCGPLVELDKILVGAGFCSSRSEAQRKIKEGAVYVDGDRETEFKTVIVWDSIKAGTMIRVGKKCKRVIWPEG